MGGLRFAAPWVVPPKLSQEHCNVHLRGLVHIINQYPVVIVNISLDVECKYLFIVIGHLNLFFL